MNNNRVFIDKTHYICANNRKRSFLANIRLQRTRISIALGKVKGHQSTAVYSDQLCYFTDTKYKQAKCIIFNSKLLFIFIVFVCYHFYEKK